MARSRVLVTLSCIAFLSMIAVDIVRAEGGLVGTWRLVSASSSTDAGIINKEVYGHNPTGTMIFTAEGRMITMIAMGERKSLSVSDRIAAPTNERAEAFSTFIAYSGRYSLSAGKETLHIDISSLQNWVNTDQTRFVSLQGDRLTLRTPPMPRGGIKQTFELVWQREK
ncbi:MAG: lipocalin-like domain-containing protein [Candidatus Sulfotelmatobacter sp.]